MRLGFSLALYLPVCTVLLSYLGFSPRQLLALPRVTYSEAGMLNGLLHS